MKRKSAVIKEKIVIHISKNYYISFKQSRLFVLQFKPERLSVIIASNETKAILRPYHYSSSFLK